MIVLRKGVCAARSTRETWSTRRSSPCEAGPSSRRSGKSSGSKPPGLFEPGPTGRRQPSNLGTKNAAVPASTVAARARHAVVAHRAFTPSRPSSTARRRTSPSTVQRAGRRGGRGCPPGTASPRWRTGRRPRRQKKADPAVADVKPVAVLPERHDQAPASPKIAPEAPTETRPPVRLRASRTSPRPRKGRGIATGRRRARSPCPGRRA